MSTTHGLATTLPPLLTVLLLVTAPSSSSAAAACTSTYTLRVKTACVSPASRTTDAISVAFGDAYRNEVLARPLVVPNGRSRSRALERCGTDTFRVAGPCGYGVCYLYLRRDGRDGWAPQWVQVVQPGPREEPPATATFYFGDPLPDGVCLNFQYKHVAQSILPPSLYPEPLRAFRRWYAAEFDDYLMANPPGFFRGLAWLELVFLWPVAVATLYGILMRRRRWAATASLVLGVVTVTSSSAILGDILGSGRATLKLLLSYVPSALLAVIAIIHGLCSCSGCATDAASSLGPSAHKKRV